MKSTYRRIFQKNLGRGEIRSDGAGFSLLEMVVVISILSIIASISIPSLWRWIALSRIDAVKTVLNSAASECLQSVREGKLPREASPKDTTISDDLLMGHGYQIKQNQSTCADFKVVPKQQDEKFLFEMGFAVTSEGDIYKIAIPAYDPGSLDSCKNWAGVGCTVSKELQDRIKAGELLALELKTCNESYQKNLQDKVTGSFMKWNSTTNSCTLEQLLYEGTPCKDQDDCGRLRIEKIGAVCGEKRKQKEAIKFDGKYTDPECPTTYFCSGKDLNTDSETEYKACKEREQETKCIAAVNIWKSGSINGQFNEPGCTTQWKCGTSYFSSQADYQSSSCGCTLVDKKFEIGTAPERVKIGTVPIYKKVCVNEKFGKCYREEDRIVGYEDIYETRDVMQYETRRVCQ